jgi:hypothetical protein
MIPLKSVKELQKCLSENKLFLSKDAYIVFVCGANVSENKHSARSRFIEYGKKYLNGIDFFIAEDFFSKVSDKDEYDLLSIENTIAQFSDCILIFLESASAIAELGAFSNNDKLAGIILAINDKVHVETPSFINFGPLAKLNKISVFKPVIYTNMDTVLDSSSCIRKKIEDHKRKRNIKIEYTSLVDFKKMESKRRMLFVLDIITLFQPVSIHDIIEILKVLLGEGYYNFSTDLNMLKTLDYIQERKGFFYRSGMDMKTYYIYKGIDLEKLRAKILLFYNKHERTKMLETAKLVGRYV